MRICDLIKDQNTFQAELGHTVLETVRIMVEHNIGAVPVLHNGKLVGIFSERDLMKRVVAEARDPRSTCLAEVMTDDPLSVRRGQQPHHLHTGVQRYCIMFQCVGERGRLRIELAAVRVRVGIPRCRCLLEPAINVDRERQ